MTQGERIRRLEDHCCMISWCVGYFFQAINLLMNHLSTYHPYVKDNPWFMLDMNTVRKRHNIAQASGRAFLEKYPDKGWNTDSAPDIDPDAWAGISNAPGEPE